MLGCGEESPTEPEAHVLAGEWDYSFVATNPIICPVEPVPVGCSGGGVLRFVQSGTSLQGSYTLFAGCQSCGSASDFGGPGDIEDLEVSGSEVRFSIAACSFSALLPERQEDLITGVVSCPDFEANGSWRMAKKK
jgi:hypothetical protein